MANKEKIRRIIIILIESPFYFDLTLNERLEMVKGFSEKNKECSFD